MNDDTYTTDRAAKLSGFTKWQLGYWAKKGMIVPTAQPSHGPGTRRLYSFDDLVQLRFIRHLKRMGWSIQKIRVAIAALREITQDSQPLNSGILIHGKHTILAMCKNKAGEQMLLDALSTGMQQVMWIVLEDLQTETKDLVQQEVIGAEELTAEGASA